MSRPTLILLLLGLSLPLGVMLACGLGAAAVPPGDIVGILAHRLGLDAGTAFAPEHEAIVWVIRLPRVLMSLLVGASLALCGTAMQGLFRNPLADPSLIGVSAGAALAAALVIVLGGPGLVEGQTGIKLPVLPVATFCGAVVSIGVIFGLARDKRRTQVATMLLAGIAINALAGAGVGLLTYLADDAQLRSLTFWTLGSLGGAQWEQMSWMALATLVTLLLLLSQAKAFNALSLGETEAQHLGIPVEVLKRRVIVATGLAVGTSVAFCGLIGFVGLVVPHLLRLAGGAQHRYLLPAAALGGGLLLMAADTLARTLVPPAEVPIGIVTSLVGAPVFLFLLFQQKENMS